MPEPCVQGLLHKLTMKKCSTCGKLKQTSEFSRNKGYKDGLNNKCKKCACEYSNIYYKEHREDLLIAMRQYHKAHKKERTTAMQEYIRKNKEWLRRYKETKECLVCGEKCVVCLDFHHQF